jgi:hypothetical protein
MGYLNQKDKGFYPLLHNLAKIKQKQAVNR